LLPTCAISSEHPDIYRTAHEIAAGAPDDKQRLRALIDWMQTHVKPEAIDVFTALDVLKSRRAECQGHAMLFAAFARSLGIPTRIVSGIVYVPRLKGFLYHSWNESLLDGRWMAVDPIYNQFPADTTHVKLVEGDAISDLLPLLNMIGKLSLNILSTSVGSSQTY
jgi:transglutaminase-like putative cysteine protease